MLLVIPHIPKCAGTLVRDLVTSTGDLYPVKWLQSSDQSIESFFRSCADQAAISENMVIGGHFTLRNAACFIGPMLASSDCAILNILRDPFERFCSHYEYHIRTPFLISGQKCVTSAVPSDQLEPPMDTGIYRSILAHQSRDIYGYYIGTGPYSPRDMRGIANSLLKYRLISFPIEKLRQACEIALTRMLFTSNTSVKPLEQLIDATFFCEGIRLNENPNGGAYAGRYPEEHIIRHIVFAGDYRILNFLYSFEGIVGGDQCLSWSIQ